jgi:hypothetical protein
MPHKNVTNVVSSNIRKVNLNWKLEAAFATTFRCSYKMLVACVSDNEGRSLLISYKKSLHIMNVMFCFLSTIFDVTMKNLSKYDFFSKVQVHSKRLEIEPTLKINHHI